MFCPLPVSCVTRTVRDEHLFYYCTPENIISILRSTCIMLLLYHYCRTAVLIRTKVLLLCTTAPLTDYPVYYNDVPPYVLPVASFTRDE